MYLLADLGRPTLNITKASGLTKNLTSLKYLYHESICQFGISYLNTYLIIPTEMNEI